MDDAWKTSLRDSFGETFRNLERVLRECPDSLWEERLWQVPDTEPDKLGLGPERQHVYWTFWFIAWHALSCAHYDLEGVAFPEWAPPAVFSGGTILARAYTRGELQEYVADTRRKADATIETLTDERIARPVAAGHRYAGILYAALLLGCLTHTHDHVAQLDMFLGQRAVVGA